VIESGFLRITYLATSSVDIQAEAIPHPSANPDFSVSEQPLSARMVTTLYTHPPDIQYRIFEQTFTDLMQKTLSHLLSSVSWRTRQECLPYLLLCMRFRPLCYYSERYDRDEWRL